MGCGIFRMFGKSRWWKQRQALDLGGSEVVLTAACFGEGKGGVGSPIEIEIVGTGQCKRRKFHGR